MAQAQEKALDDAVRLMSAVLARGADSPLVHSVAEKAVQSRNRWT